MPAFHAVGGGSIPPNLIKLKVNNSFTFLSYYSLAKIESTFKLKINLIATYTYLLYLKIILKTKQISIFVSSKKLTVTTVFKSPMAQKTWSREQVFIKYYRWSFLLRQVVKQSPIIPFFFIGKCMSSSLSNNLMLLYRTTVTVKTKFDLYLK